MAWVTTLRCSQTPSLAKRESLLGWGRWWGRARRQPQQLEPRGWAGVGSPTSCGGAGDGLPRGAILLPARFVCAGRLPAGNR